MDEYEYVPYTAPEEALAAMEPPTIAIPEFTLCLGTRGRPTSLLEGDKIHIRPATKECRFTRFQSVGDQALFVITPDGGVRQSLILADAPQTDDDVKRIASEIARRFSLDAIRFKRKSEKTKDGKTVAFLLAKRLEDDDE